MLRSGAMHLTTPAIYATRYAVEVQQVARAPAPPAAEPVVAPGSAREDDDDGWGGLFEDDPEADGAGALEGEGEATRHDELPVGEAPSGLAEWRSRGAGWRERTGREWTSLFHVEISRLALHLQNCGDLRLVCRIAARIICPEKDITHMQFPGQYQVRLSKDKSVYRL